jgi:hypothetical protein
LETWNGRDSFEHMHVWEYNIAVYLKGTGVKMIIWVKFIWLRTVFSSGLLAIHK